MWDRLVNAWAALRGKGAVSTPAPAAPAQPPETTRSLRAALGGRGLAWWTSDHANEATHLTGWTYVAVHAKAKQAMQATLVVGRKAPARDAVQTKAAANPDAYTPVTDVLPESHPAARLLTRPSWRFDGGLFRYQLIQQLDTTGTALVWAVPNSAGSPAELWVIPTGSAQPQPPSPTYPEGSYRVSLVGLYATFGLSATAAAGVSAAAGAMIDARWVCPIRWPHPLFPGDGLSPLAAGSRLVDIAEQVDEATWHAMTNEVRPGTVLGLDPTLKADPDDLARLQRALDEMKGHLGRTLVVQGATPHQLGRSPAELDYVNGRSQARDNVLALHGVAPIAAGITEAGSYAAFIAAMKQTTELSVQPELDLIGGSLGHWLGRWYGTDLTVTLQAKGHDDPAVLEARLKTDLSAGNVLTVREYRALRGDPPFGDDRDDAFAGAKQGGPPGGQQAPAAATPGDDTTTGETAPEADALGEGLSDLAEERQGTPADKGLWRWRAKGGEFDEAKHPRAANGQFGSGSGTPASDKDEDSDQPDDEPQDEEAVSAEDRKRAADVIAGKASLKQAKALADDIESRTDLSAAGLTGEHREQVAAVLAKLPAKRLLDVHEANAADEDSWELGAVRDALKARADSGDGDDVVTGLIDGGHDTAFLGSPDAVAAHLDGYKPKELAELLNNAEVMGDADGHAEKAVRIACRNAVASGTTPADRAKTAFKLADEGVDLSTLDLDEDAAARDLATLPTAKLQEMADSGNAGDLPAKAMEHKAQTFTGTFEAATKLAADVDDLAGADSPAGKAARAALARAIESDGEPRDRAARVLRLADEGFDLDSLPLDRGRLRDDLATLPVHELWQAHESHRVTDPDGVGKLTGEALETIKPPPATLDPAAPGKTVVLDLRTLTPAQRQEIGPLIDALPKVRAFAGRGTALINVPPESSSLIDDALYHADPVSLDDPDGRARLFEQSKAPVQVAVEHVPNAARTDTGAAVAGQNRVNPAEVPQYKRVTPDLYVRYDPATGDHDLVPKAEVPSLIGVREEHLEDDPDAGTGESPESPERLERRRQRAEARAAKRTRKGLDWWWRKGATFDEAKHPRADNGQFGSKVRGVKQVLFRNAQGHTTTRTIVQLEQVV